MTYERCFLSLQTTNCVSCCVCTGWPVACLRQSDNHNQRHVGSNLRLLVNTVNKQTNKQRCYVDWVILVIVWLVMSTQVRT